MLRGLSQLDGPRLRAVSDLMALVMRFVITLCVLAVCVWVIAQQRGESYMTFAGMLASAVCGYWFGAAIPRPQHDQSAPQIGVQQVEINAEKGGNANVNVE